MVVPTEPLALPAGSPTSTPTPEVPARKTWSQSVVTSISPPTTAPGGREGWLTDGTPGTRTVAYSQFVTVQEDTPKVITLVALDAENDALTYVVLSGPSHGSLSGSGPNRTYTPSPEYSGPDSFTFRTFDGTSFSNIASVSITVVSVNDPPVAIGAELLYQ